MAHTSTASANLIKVAVYGWNPLALNWAELLRVPKALFGTMRANHDRERATQNHLDQRLLGLLSCLT